MIQCNWKVYIDNYLEGYHLPAAHPGLYRALDYSKYRVDLHRYYSSQYAPLRQNSSVTRIVLLDISELHAEYLSR